MRFTLATILALGAFVVASPVAELEARHGNNNDNVNTSTWCCNGKSWTKSASYEPSAVLQNVFNGHCSPVGLNAGAACSTQVVRCDHMDQHGLVNVGCVPVNV